MLTLVSISCLFVMIVTMAVLAVLYKLYEEPLHKREPPPPADETALVERAKRETKAGDQRLN
jgi:hypothetical protein